MLEKHVLLPRVLGRKVVIFISLLGVAFMNLKSECPATHFLLDYGSLHNNYYFESFINFTSLASLN